MQPQVAFAIGRGFGNAVERNRGRRRLRAAFVEVWKDAGQANADQYEGAFLLGGNRGLLTKRYPELVADVGACLNKLGARS